MKSIALGIEVALPAARLEVGKPLLHSLVGILTTQRDGAVPQSGFLAARMEDPVVCRVY